MNLSPSSSAAGNAGFLIYRHTVDTAQSWYTTLLLVNGSLSVLMFPLVFYLLRFKSPAEMTRCVRVMVMNACATATVIGVLFAVWLPIPLHPELAGFSLGLFRRLPSGWCRAIFGIWLLLQLNLATNYMFAFLHYYALLKPGWALHRQFHRVSFQFCVVYGIVLALIFLFVLGSTLTVIQWPDQLLAYAQTFPPGHFVQQTLANEPSTLGLSANTGQPAAFFFMLLLMAAVVGLTLVILAMNAGILLEIQRTREHVQAATHALQVTAYLRLFLAKTLLLVLFMVLPLLLTTGFAMFGLFSSLQLQLLAYSLFSFHSPLLLLQTILLIRPYRQFVWQTACKFPRRIGLAIKRQTTSTSQVGIVQNIEATKTEQIRR